MFLVIVGSERVWEAVESFCDDVISQKEVAEELSQAGRLAQAAKYRLNAAIRGASGQSIGDSIVHAARSLEL